MIINRLSLLLILTCLSIAGCNEQIPDDKIDITIHEDGKYILPCSPFKLYGGYYSEEDGGYYRLPKDVAENTSGWIYNLKNNVAGMRYFFSTDSEYLRFDYSIDVEYFAFTPYDGSCNISLMEIIGGEYIPIEPTFKTNDYTLINQVFEYRFEKKDRDLVVFLPTEVNRLSVELTTTIGAKIWNRKQHYLDSLPILYYGSSITHGIHSSEPRKTYPALVSQWTNIDFINLGFSGGACGEPAIREYLANQDCSIFVLDYDWNAPNADYLNYTHIEMYKAFRSVEKNKNTPIIMMSMPNFRYFQQSDVDARFAVIERTYQYALDNGDSNVYLIDGRKIFPLDELDQCHVDKIHPTDLGLYYMAKAVFETIEKIQKA